MNMNLPDKESEQVEFKKSFATEKEILETICAFSNTKGGRIYIGIDDNGKVIGTGVGKNTLEHFTAKIIKDIKPYPNIEIKEEEINGKKIVVISVKKSDVSPHFCRGIAYKRSGKSNIKMDPSEIEKLIIERRKKNLRFETLTQMEHASINDIDKKVVESYAKKINKKVSNLRLFLKKSGLIVGDKLTNAALLLFGKNPQSFFPYAEVKIIIKDRLGEISGYKLISGNLIKQAEDIEKTIKEILPYKVKIENFRRVKEYIFPLEAIREGVINALVHRDYSIPSYTYITVEPDRITIKNPGVLPEGLTVKQLYREHASILRNQIMARVFHELGYIEAWGEGTIKILRLCNERGLFVKFNELDTNFFELEIANAYSELDELDYKIMELLKEGPMKSSEIAKKLGISLRTIRYHLHNLTTAGKILAKGEKRGRIYYI